MIGPLNFQIQIEPKVKASIGIMAAANQNVELSDRNEFVVIDIDEHEWMPKASIKNIISWKT